MDVPLTGRTDSEVIPTKKIKDSTKDFMIGLYGYEFRIADSAPPYRQNGNGYL